MSEWDFLWGLSGQELMDAMASGGTYADWEYIEKKEEELEKKAAGAKEKTAKKAKP